MAARPQPAPGTDGAVTNPNVLTTFVPKGKTMWEFLDLIEAAYEWWPGCAG